MAISTIVIRATVITAWLRTMQPKPAKGTNHIVVPRKKQEEQHRLNHAAHLAALKPAATKGGHKLKPVSKPNTAAPEVLWLFTAPMLTNFCSAHVSPQTCFADYAYQISTQARITLTAPISTHTMRRKQRSQRANFPGHSREQQVSQQPRSQENRECLRVGP